MDVGNLISDSSAFLKFSLYIWKFLVHILLMPSLKNFTLLASEMSETVWYSLNILWHCLPLGLEWNLTFSSPVAIAEFSKFAGILSAALWKHFKSFRIWDSSAGIPSPPLAFLIVILPKAHLTSLHTPGCLALGERPQHHDYPGHEGLFCTVLLCILAASS